ncbi:MAK16-like protein [Chloropicon primus]|uniref:Protein MAK16 homolog n=1 Tax=Chloropicon primus TaxID=1764295 RepID=A0A5B8MYI1_9CHLO|nr:MAK16-like protein [Chloropicon primus]UPR04814.1 MAK16-like protein [Chloropicon primus]|mmetsp:Transcript_5014/g.15000  ORF Transcript_5014/g.15000 Transcript_5014/m.15000 type:complete len:341 (-) Transcript_5014:518-1540(-)|eukprot:QDZ25617.1 MAK16-like protein [Chloropicon primus]
MQNDEIIWSVINHHHCSFKVSTKMQNKETQNFCRNQYNVTGLCNRSSCPLANSRYATILEEKGRCYLYMKTIERAHSPKNLWQRVKLSRNYAKALEQIDSHLKYWPKFLVHKNKQRLTKITQYLIRMKRLALRVRPKLVTVPARKEKVERKREAKAEAASNVDREIEKELLSRLQSGNYQDIYNFPAKQYNKVLNQEEEEAEREREEEYDSGEDSQRNSLLSDGEGEEGEAEYEEEFEGESEEEQDEDDEEIEFVEGYDYLNDSDIESFELPNADLEALDNSDSGEDYGDSKGKGKGKKKRPTTGKKGKKGSSSKKPRKNIEVEYEHEPKYATERQAVDY